MFKLELKTGNAAFEDCPQREVARILLEIVSDIMDYNQKESGSCVDINGNVVGKWELNDM